jgi:flagellar hook-associated protein 1 FlgK
MANFDIGLTGLNAARKGLDVIGNNIANAATEGYRRQKIDLTPAFARLDGSTMIGGGVDIGGVTSLVNNFLEQEILRQQSSLSQVSQEASTLKNVETSFGELSSSSGLSAAIDKYFNSLKDLSAHPDQIAYQNEVLSAGDMMAGQFRTLGNFFVNLESQIKLQAENVVDQINSLAGQIATLNENIQSIEMNGSQANNLVDQRDQLVTKMSELTGVEVQQRDYGVVDVSIGGIPVVMGATTMQLSAGLQDDSLLGITPSGTYAYQTTVEGGQLGGLLALYNGQVHDIHSDIDTLATSIIQQVNQYHVQGVGTDGAFTGLNGKVMSSQDVSDFVPPVTNGSFFIRLTYTDPVSHEVTVTRHEISVNTTDTLGDVADAISNVTGLSASAGDDKLSIQADANYKFDFLPASLPEPTSSTFTGSPPPSVSVSGVYTGTENQTFTFTVVGSGEVGNGTLQLQVRDGDSNLIDTLNIGSGYAAGDKLDFGNGIKIAVGSGQLNAGDIFGVKSFANTDTSGLLATIGMNTFFTGNNASNMAVSDDIADSPGRIASAMGPDLTDNANAKRLASLGDTTIDGLGSMTAGEFYRKLVTEVGQQVSLKQTLQTNGENLIQSLTNQQSDISGVDINEEAAQMIVFQQMFQASAKYLSTVQTTITTLMNIWG